MDIIDEFQRHLSKEKTPSFKLLTGVSYEIDRMEVLLMRAYAEFNSTREHSVLDDIKKYLKKRELLDYHNQLKWSSKNYETSTPAS